MSSRKRKNWEFRKGMRNREYKLSPFRGYLNTGSLNGGYFGGLINSPHSNGILNPLQILGSNLPFWMRADRGMYLDTGFTMPTSSNNATILGVQDQSGNTNNGTQATAGNAFTLLTNQINGLPALQPAGATSSYALGSNITLGGAFTLYTVAKRATSTVLVPLGDGVGNAYVINLFSDNNAYTSNSGGTGTGNAPYTGSAGYIALRFRRNSSNQVFLAASGMAEIQIGTTVSGNYIPGYIFANVLGSQYSPTSDQFAELFLANVDCVSSGQDTALRAYLTNRYNLTIP